VCVHWRDLSVVKLIERVFALLIQPTDLVPDARVAALQEPPSAPCARPDRTRARQVCVSGVCIVCECVLFQVVSCVCMILPRKTWGC
jgi:hypothetical protein